MDELKNSNREGSMESSAPDRPPLGWVLYDASCGICSRWVPFWEPTLRKHGFKPVPLQTPWVKERLGMAESELLEDFRLLLADGRQARGADAYRQVMKHIPWAYPIYLLACAPGLRRVIDWAYRWFARSRFGISRACGLPPNVRRPA